MGKSSRLWHNSSVCGTMCHARYYMHEHALYYIILLILDYIVMNNGVTFRRNGEIMLFGHLVGVWTCHDVWLEHGGRYDASGNRLVHYLWQVDTIDGKHFVTYASTDARQWVLRKSETLLQLTKNMTEAEKWEAINNAR